MVDRYNSLRAEDAFRKLREEIWESFDRVFGNLFHNTGAFWEEDSNEKLIARLRDKFEGLQNSKTPKEIKQYIGEIGVYLMFLHNNQEVVPTNEIQLRDLKLRKEKDTTTTLWVHSAYTSLSEKECKELSEFLSREINLG